MISLPMISAIFCCILLGGVACWWGQIPWALATRSTASEAVASRWQTGFSLPLVGLFPLLGTMLDDWGGKTPLFLGILGITISLTWLGQHASLRSGLGAMLLFAVSIPCVALPTLAMLPAAFDLTPVLAFNLGFIGIGVSAAAAPFVFKLVLRRFNFRNGYLILALACLLPALFVSIAPESTFHPPRPAPPAAANQEQTPAAKDTKATVSPAPALPPQDSHWWVLMTLGFCMSALQVLAGCWRKAFLAEHEQGKRITRIGYWLAYFGTMAAAGWLIPDGYAAWGLACLAGIHAVILGNLAGVYPLQGGVAGYWLAGATVAPLLPTLLAIPFVYFANFHESTVLGTLCGSMCLGQVVLKNPIERWVPKWSFAAIIRVTLLLTLVLGALALSLALMHSELYGNPRRIRPARKPHHGIFQIFRPHAADQSCNRPVYGA